MQQDALLIQALGGQQGLARKAFLVVAGSALIALSAQITVPMWPVPMTLQTLAVLLIGLTYGARLGSATVLAYLAEGAAGMPVFAKGGAGMAHLLGPTGGYLIGFAIAAALVGWLAGRGWSRGPIRTALAMALGNLALYLPGLLWLKGATGMSWAKAWALGAAPFLAGDALKLLIAALLVPGAWALLRRFGRGAL